MAVVGIIGIVQAVNGTAMCESVTWQEKWARDKLGFEGNIVTDCTALSMPGPEAKVDPATNAARGMAAGTDLNCGDGDPKKRQAYAHIEEAIGRKLPGATTERLDELVGRVEARARRERHRNGRRWRAVRRQRHACAL